MIKFQGNMHPRDLSFQFSTAHNKNDNNNNYYV